MAFWGVEVKPKKSFTLKFTEFEGPRLHLSQATLGITKSNERTIVKCRVANSPALYLCSLLPGTAETCSLDLYFDQDVIFSVKGSTSVHLVGYFEGTFDGNESGEDVEDDGYSDEEDLEDSDDSLGGFIVSEDEDVYDDEDDSDDKDWLSEEDVPMRARKSGVTIEELPPDEPSLHGSKTKVENQERSLVPHKKSKHREAKEVANASVECRADTNGDGTLKQEHDNLQMVVETDDKHASSSEDEDGFHVKRKRKMEDVDNEQPSKTMSTSMHTEAPQPVIAPLVAQDMDTDSKGSSEKKKKKKKKKKKSKDSPEAVSSSPMLQVNGSLETPLKQGDSAKKGKMEMQGSKSNATSVEQNVSKKGTVRKYSNGLEVENTSMGKPDGKQATPGKRVGIIYTGRLRSNGKIFDSNVGNKPFHFRLGKAKFLSLEICLFVALLVFVTLEVMSGVGEVIKGWDVGVNGMRVGDKRRLTIPPIMGYGSKGVPGIPPNSWLVFDVEMVEAK